MLEEINYRNIIDYIFLLRVMKFSKKGLAILFQSSDMGISRIGTLKKDFITRMLLINKKASIDNFNKISELYNFDFNNSHYREIEEMVKHCFANSFSILTPFSEDIPKLLRILDVYKRDLVFVKGKIYDNDLRSYSICGTRNPTKDAVVKTREIAKELAMVEFTLLNGFARGTDTEAFLAAAEKGGRYIGVLASGIENIYPPENKPLETLVLENGALISQNLIWNRVSKPTLQIRNRLSAQLSLGSIFIEGDYKSGTKWQFKYAKEVGVPIFYLEPLDWHHPNAHVPKIIKEAGGIEIKNDLSNIDVIIDILNKEFDKRMVRINES